MAIVGLKDVVYCIMTDEEAETYSEEVKTLAGAIDMSIQPSVDVAELYADDGLDESVSEFSKATIAFQVKDIPTEVKCDLLGHTYSKFGGAVKKGTDQAPYVAIGFKSRLSKGGYRFKWLTKVKFTLPDESHKTKGEKLEFQTPTINGTAMRRKRDEVWEDERDTTNTLFTEAKQQSYFNKPYELEFDEETQSVTE
jgi:phi13 family phage major tail protein